MTREAALLIQVSLAFRSRTERSKSMLRLYLTRRVNGRYVLATIASLALAVAGSASAKKSSPWLAVNPTTAVMNQPVVFTGCGYEPNAAIRIGVHAPYAAISFQSSTDSSGCFDSSTWENFAPQQPGEYYADTWQSGRRALAGVEFAVVQG
jgi:hypothetical protein